MARWHRSPIRYYGGKGAIAPWIRSHVQQELVGVWVEPFAGGLHVAHSLDWTLLGHEVTWEPRLLIAEADPVVREWWTGLWTDPELVHHIVRATRAVIHYIRQHGEGRAHQDILLPLRDWLVWVVRGERGMMEPPDVPILLDRRRALDVAFWIRSRTEFGGYQGPKKSGYNTGYVIRFLRDGLASLSWCKYVISHHYHIGEIRRDESDPELLAAVREAWAGGGAVVVYLDPPYAGDSRTCRAGFYASEYHAGRTWTPADVAALWARWTEQVPWADVMLSHYWMGPELHEKIRSATATGRICRVSTRVTTASTGRASRDPSQPVPARVEGLWLSPAVEGQSALRLPEQDEIPSWQVEAAGPQEVIRWDGQ